MAYATERSHAYKLRSHAYKLRLFRCSEFDLSPMSDSDQNNELLINKLPINK